MCLRDFFEGVTSPFAECIATALLSVLRFCSLSQDSQDISISIKITLCKDDSADKGYGMMRTEEQEQDDG